MLPRFADIFQQGNIYTLKYLRDPQMERNIRRSQNRIESYHQLRAAVAKVGERKS